MDYKQEMVKRLKDDCKILIEKKIPKALENVNDEKGQGINTYRNLTKALAENIKLIEEYGEKYVLTVGNNDTPYNTISKAVKCKIIEDTKTKLGDNVVVLPEFAELKKLSDMETDKEDNKYEEFKNQMDYTVENFSQGNQITIPVSEIMRGIGKTTYLANKAIENNGVVVVGHRYKIQYIHEFINKNVVAIRPNQIEMYDCNVPLYIDEEVSWDTLKDVVRTRPYVRLKYCPLNVN